MNLAEYRNRALPRTLHDVLLRAIQISQLQAEMYELRLNQIERELEFNDYPHHNSDLYNSGLTEEEIEVILIQKIPIIITEKIYECALCESSIPENSVAKLLINCGHYFHIDCIDSCLRQQDCCPACHIAAI